MWRVCWLTRRLPNVYTQPWMHLSVLSGCITPTISVARRSISESLCGRADTLLPAGPTGRAGADPDGAELRDEADSLVATGRELPDGQIPPRKRAHCGPAERAVWCVRRATDTRGCGTA